MTYSNTQVFLHWASAILIFGLAGSGLAYSFDLIDRPALTAHQYMGQVLILLLVTRIVLRLRRPRPKTETPHAAWEQRLANAVHFGLYLCLIAFVITGYISASALTNNALLLPADRGFARSDTGELLLEVHFALKWALLGLFLLHLAGALKHIILDRDDTFSRMLFTKQ